MIIIIVVLLFLFAGRINTRKQYYPSGNFNARAVRVGYRCALQNNNVYLRVRLLRGTRTPMPGKKIDHR